MRRCLHLAGDSVTENFRDKTSTGKWSKTIKLRKIMESGLCLCRVSVIRSIKSYWGVVQDCLQETTLFFLYHFIRCGRSVNNEAMIIKGHKSVFSCGGELWLRFSAILEGHCFRESWNILSSKIVTSFSPRRRWIGGALSRPGRKVMNPW